MKSIDNLFAKIGSYPWRGDSDMADFDALVEAVQDEIREGYIELPMDADGVPIRVGDKVVDWDTPRLVVAVSEDSICLAGYESDSYYRMGIAKNYRHYHEPTVEDVLREFAEKVIDSQIPDVHPTYEEAIVEYASKLRMANDGKEQ